MDLSVVIPLLNEEESLEELYRWLVSVLEKEGYTFEILFIDDGSTDGSWEIIRRLAEGDPRVRGFRFRRNYGKSQALHLGFKEARGETVITMDADLQDNPEEIPALVRMIREQGYDLVSCWKKVRRDPVLTKNLPSKIFNWAARRVSGISLHDFNCGLKAYRREVVKKIPMYGEMHRFIPFLAIQAGFDKIGEKPVKHMPRKYGRSKFGSDRFIKGVLDMITLWFLLRFSKRPMYLFGGLGLIMFLIGFLAIAVILGIKAYKLYRGIPTHLVTDRPWFYIALTALLAGIQFFLAGFLGELILQTDKRGGDYDVAEQTHPPSDQPD
ncbi:MAG: glycosyltransferase family 2 protein [Chlorobi bacterium]|nr:glycosyltransferase family 2 protein [Chlorobiota bacterium]